MGEVVHCKLEERNTHDPFAVTLKKAGTGTVGHQQAEIEILHCPVVEHKNLHLSATSCVKFKARKFLNKRYP